MSNLTPCAQYPQQAYPLNSVKNSQPNAKIGLLKIVCTLPHCYYMAGVCS